jgi:aspartate carbamoyltransferase catalytic subunit
MPGTAHGTSIRCVGDISTDLLQSLFEVTAEYSLREGRVGSPLARRTLGMMFFQPSTRTRLSYEKAALNLGATVLGFSDISSTRSSSSTGETLEDAARVFGELADAIVIRHYVSGAAHVAARCATVPVINGGDGSNEHPTQALIDAWVLSRRLGDVRGATVGIVGDPGARALRSFALLMSSMGVKKLLFLLPPSARLHAGDQVTHCSIPADVARALQLAGTGYEFRNDVRELLEEADGIEMMPIDIPPLEAAPDALGMAAGITPERFRISSQKVFETASNAVLLHPGPRRDELHPDTDDLPNSAYFEQVRQGVYVRMSVLNHVVGGST